MPSADDPGDDGLEILRAYLAKMLELVEQRHTARPQRKPARYYLRRNAHRTYLRYAYGRVRCR